MFGRFPLLLVPETDTKGDTPLVLFASLHGKMASRTLLSKIYEVKKIISYIFAIKKVLLLHTPGAKHGQLVRYLDILFCTFFVII